MPTKSDKDTLRKVHHARAAVAGFFQTKWEKAKENAKFYRLVQYSDAQLAKFTQDKRVPYVLDYVSNAINAYLGVQRDQRTDIAFLPVEKEDEVKVEVLNSVKDAVLRKNQFQYVESDIFQDGLIELCGFLGYEWSDQDNPLGELKLFRIPQRQMSWDINRRDYSLSKSTWVSRMRLQPKREMMRKHPDHAKEIERMQLSASVLDNLGLDDTYLKQIVYGDLDSLAYIEFYEKDFKTKYFLIDDKGTVGDEIYETKKDAEKAVKNVMRQMSESGLPTPNLTIKGKEFPTIYKSEVLHGTVLTDTKDIDEPFYPYDGYYPYWHDGEYWSVMDTFKDAQKFINKMMSLIDHQITTSSKGTLFVDDKVPDPIYKKIVDTWSKTGGVLKMPDPEHNIKFVESKGFDPRYLSAQEMAITNLEKKAGGGNFLGHRETASESGVAVRQRIEQGSLTSFVVYDNLSRFKKEVGEKIMWYLSNFMTAAQKIRLEGKDLTQFAQTQFPEWFKPSLRPSVGFLEINTTHENSLEGLKADVIVDEAKHSVTKNAAVLQQLSVAMQSSPLLAETIPPMMLIGLMDIPATEKQEWMSASQQLMQAKMQKDQAEAQKPPSISATLKDIESLDPQDQAQFMEKFFGIKMSAPVKIEQPDTGEGEMNKMILKAAIDHQHNNAKFALEHTKHKDSIALELAKLAGQHSIEDSRMEHDAQVKKEQSKKRSNGNAVQK